MRTRILLASVVMLTALAGTVHAGWHVVFEGINSHMEYTPDTPTTINDPPTKAVVSVYNKTTVALAYTVNGQACTHQVGNQRVGRASPEAWTRWTVTGAPPVIDISFDNGKNETKSYRPEPNGSYQFQFDQGGALNLFKQ